MTERCGIDAISAREIKVGKMSSSRTCAATRAAFKDVEASAKLAPGSRCHVQCRPVNPERLSKTAAEED